MPMRETTNGIEILMVRRNQDLSFGGMWTFPGGRIEPADGWTPENIDEDVQNWGEPALLATAATAGVRETREETALVCNPAALAWHSHWIPPKEVPKRFATWFFIAPEASGEIIVDRSENDEARWTTAEEALAAYERDEFPLAVPTWVTLDDLRGTESVAMLVDHAVTQGARLYHTHSLRTPDKSRLLCWDGDAAYETLDSEAPGERNRVVVDGGFRVVERKQTS